MKHQPPKPTEEELRRVEAYLRNHPEPSAQHARNALQMTIIRIWACMEELRAREHR